MFPALFNKSSQQGRSVSMMGSVDNNVWNWKLSWTEALSSREAADERELFNLLHQIRPRLSGADRHRWIPSADGYFNVKSAYSWLQNRNVVDNLDNNMVISLKKLWKNNVPSKVSIFCWRLLLEKLPTREALYHKGVINNNVERCCVFCFKTEETMHHLFLHCDVSAAVWRAIFTWLGTCYLNSSTSLQQHFLYFGGLFK
jgi:hypothetical protein